MKSQIVFSIVGALILTIASSQWTPDPFCPFPYPDHPTRYPYYGNCSVFWECFDGAKYVMECPEGLEFNAPLQQCDAPEIANCDPFASTTANPNHNATDGTDSTITDTPTSGPLPQCPSGDEIVYFPYAGDCTKYWECYEGNRYLYNCPSGLWWHQEISKCDYPGDFCNNATTSPWSTIPPSTPPPITPTTGGNDPRCTQGGTTFWPQTGTCSRYVKCVDGLSYILDCPPETYFSDRVKDCVRADESECCAEKVCSI